MAFNLTYLRQLRSQSTLQFPYATLLLRLCTLDLTWLSKLLLPLVKLPLLGVELDKS